MIRRIILLGVVAALGVLFAVTQSNSASAQPAGTTQDAYATKTPVLAGACKACPWGALGEIVKKQMAFYGYDVEMCYNCNLQHGPRIVAERRLAPQLTDRNRALGISTRPTRPADFGITSIQLLNDAYNGKGPYKDDPRKNLRLLAFVENPNYLTIAVKAESGITDVAQLKGRSGLKIMAGAENDLIEPILSYYGLEKEKVEADGGKFLNPGDLEKSDDFDIIIHGGLMGNNPEANVWYEKTQRHNLRFLQLPDDLLDRLAKEFRMDRAEMPISYFRGLDRPIQTVARQGHVVFVRDDAPDSFAYDVAKAVNEHRDLLKYGLIHFSLDSRTVWKAHDVPLHQGAARYYREVGYMK